MALHVLSYVVGTSGSPLTITLRKGTLSLPITVDLCCPCPSPVLLKLRHEGGLET